MESIDLLDPDDGVPDAVTVHTAGALGTGIPAPPGPVPSATAEYTAPPVGVEVTVLMPCLNEAETLETCVRKTLTCLSELGVSGEVLVSDNGSTDGSQEIARHAGARVVSAPVRGYGGALMAGIEAARGRYTIMADADDSYDLSSLGPFIERLRDGDDLVMGNRFRGGIAPGAMPPLHRYLGNPVLSWLGRRLFRLPGVGDFHCGIRGFATDRIRALDLCMPGMEFASELVVRAALAGYRITEVPATLNPDGRSRPPHLRTWRDGWRHLRFLLVLAPRTTLTWPGTILSVFGLVAVATLVAGPTRIGNVTLDVDALAYACACLTVGVQTVLIGGFAELYGRREGLVHRGSASWTRILRLEVCVVIGLALVAVGLAGTAVALFWWSRAGFGPLNPRIMIRVVLPSVAMVGTGVNVVFAGFLASLLTLRGVRGTELTSATEPPAARMPTNIGKPGPDFHELSPTGEGNA